MRNYSCIIIDDEEIGRDLLENFVGRVPHLVVLGKFSNPYGYMKKFENDKEKYVPLQWQEYMK